MQYCALCSQSSSEESLLWLSLISFIFSHRKSALPVDNPFLAVLLNFLSLSLALSIISVVIATCDGAVSVVLFTGCGFILELLPYYVSIYYLSDFSCHDFAISPW